MATPKPRKGFNLGVVLKVVWRAATEVGFTDKLRGVLGQPPSALALPAPAAAPALPPPTASKAAEKKPAPPPLPPKPTAEPLRLLTLMQREGRLIDFLMEDVAGFSDAQIGAAVRDIHKNCRKVLDEHLVIDGVVPEKEDQKATVPVGFDPSAIQLVGNLVGDPPFTGTVRHRGWKVKEIKLPPAPAAQDQFVLAPAEVELA